MSNCRLEILSNIYILPFSRYIIILFIKYLNSFCAIYKAQSIKNVWHFSVIFLIMYMFKLLFLSKKKKITIYYKVFTITNKNIENIFSHIFFFF